MADCFVASSSPQGWKLGKWTKVGATQWQEEKLENNKIVYKFSVVGGGPPPNTVRLKMADQNTEVLLLEASAQIFVNGSYLGEYCGQWQNARGAPAARSAPAAQGRASITQQKSQPPAAEPAFEQTQAPANQKSLPPGAQKSAPPAAQKSAPPGRASVGGGSRAPPDLSDFPPPLPDAPSGPKKAEGLDKSPDKLKALVDAAAKGDAATVKNLLDSGVDPDGPAKDGRTPLMAATNAGSLPCVEALVAACADPTLGKGNETPMTIAFQKGKQDILKALFAASFQTLENMVAAGSLDRKYSLSQVTQGETDVPESAMDDLRVVTAQLARVGGASPTAAQTSKYGNYSDTFNQSDLESKDSDFLREESVRLAMRNLVKENKQAKYAVS